METADVKEGVAKLTALYEKVGGLIDNLHHDIEEGIAGYNRIHVGTVINANELEEALYDFHRAAESFSGELQQHFSPDPVSV